MPSGRIEHGTLDSPEIVTEVNDSNQWEVKDSDGNVIARFDQDQATNLFSDLFDAANSQLVYDSSAQEVTADVNNSLVTTDEVDVEDTSADPTANGEFTLNGSDIKAFTGGGVKSLSDIGSGTDDDVFDDLASGLIVYLRGDGSRQTLDPSTTSTPIQDVYDDIDDNKSTSVTAGTIYLPPGQISTPGDIDPKRGIDLRGIGGLGRGDGTELVVTTQGNNCFTFDGSFNSDLGFYNFSINMGRGNATPTGSAFYLTQTGGQIRNCVFRNMRLFGCTGNPMIYADSGFETSWDNIKIDSTDCGNSNGVISWNGGAPNYWGDIAIYPDDDFTGSNSHAFQNSGNHWISMLNLGGTLGRALWDFSGQTTVGHINYEPVGQPANPSEVILTAGTGFWLGYLQVYGGSTTVDDVYALKQDNNNLLDNVSIPEPSLIGSTVNGDFVNVGHDTTGTVIYRGKASDVNNTSGSALTNPISCAGDGVYKTSTGAGFTAGTDRRVSGYFTESANAESPQGSYTAGDIVEFTDSGDGTGDGIYIIESDGSTATQIN